MKGEFLWSSPVIDADIVLPGRQGRALPALAPGLALTGGIAALSFALRLIPGVSVLSPMILSVLIGVGLHNVMGAPRAAHEGVAFSLRQILRVSIILLGLQITAGQAAEIGAPGIAGIVGVLLATLAFTILVGRLLGVPRGLALLIGVGTSICGASAVIAAKTATGGKDEDAAYAIACVTLFGTIAMFGYPIADGVLHLAPRAYGVWAGASIHEVAQAVAAAFQGGSQAGEFGAIAKLTRVAMMAPVVIALGEATARFGLSGAGERARPPFPWFLIGFLALAAFNTLVAMPHAIAAPIGVVAAFLLSMAMAAMGLHTDIGRLRARGLRPLALGLLASLFISLVSLLMVRVIP
jgi:uncharacterized integral membrane protein (TIGR00698 family)